nr:lysosomal Pro-X carboxypeptidase-like [Ipomoea batatas]
MKLFTSAIQWQWLLLLQLIFLSSTTCGSLPHEIPRLTPFYEPILQHSSSKPLPPDFRAFYYTQTLDHFNYAPESYATFQQRYIVNSKYWGGAQSNSPIFAWLGAESPIDFDPKTAGFLPNITPHFKALLVYIEHRFYGESIPFGEGLINDTIRGFFNSAQALADYAQYPHIALGALASYAPILYFDHITPEDGYYSIVTKDFREVSDTCYQTIKQSWSIIDTIASQPNGLSILRRKFNLCWDLNSALELKNYLDRMYCAAAQYDTPAQQPVRVVCGGIDGAPKGADILDRIQAGVVAISGNQSCYTVSTIEGKQSFYTISAGGYDGWSWQTCSELVFPIAKGNDSMFDPVPFNLEQYSQSCISAFGVPPRPHWVTTYFGGQDVSESCYQTIRKSWSIINKIASKPNDLYILSRKFKLCQDLNLLRDLKDYLDLRYSVAAQYDTPSKYPVTEVCGGIDGAPKGTHILDRIFARFFASEGNQSCYSIPIGNAIWGWSWQRCSEMVIPIEHGDGATMFFPTPFNLQQFPRTTLISLGFHLDHIGSQPIMEDRGNHHPDKGTRNEHPKVASRIAGKVRDSKAFICFLKESPTTAGAQPPLSPTTSSRNRRHDLYVVFERVAAIVEEVLHHVATPPATAYGSNSTFSFRMAIKLPNVFELAPSQPRCAPGRRSDLGSTEAVLDRVILIETEGVDFFLARVSVTNITSSESSSFLLLVEIRGFFPFEERAADSDIFSDPARETPETETQGADTVTDIGMDNTEPETERSGIGSDTNKDDTYGTDTGTDADTQTGADSDMQTDEDLSKGTDPTTEGSDAASGDSGPLGKESGVFGVDSGLLVEAELSVGVAGVGSEDSVLFVE